MIRNRSITFLFLIVMTSALFAGALPIFAAPPPSVRLNHRHPKTARSRKGVSTYGNSAEGDFAAFDDPIVRQAAIRGLGRYYGSVVAIDPYNGRILSIVNQKLAFSAGFKPCSTIKPVIAVAALQEGIVDSDTKIRVARRRYLNLTEAMAHSNNAYFEDLGRRLGFDVVSSYARMLGLGELAGYQIPEEQSGSVPAEPPKRGGVARMSSFGEGIQMTPLQLGALVSTIANGGTLYYLQYPQTVEEVENFQPRVKRTLDIKSLLPDLREGMHAAVLRGTARRSNMPDREEASGKTGSCSDSGYRIGWFASYVDQAHLKIVLVILMRGNTFAVRGPMAAGIAGRIYHELDAEEYFTNQDSEASNAAFSPPSGQ